MATNFVHLCVCVCITCSPEKIIQHEGSKEQDDMFVERKIYIIVFEEVILAHKIEEEMTKLGKTITCMGGNVVSSLF